jgi:hypothetical protein
MIKTACSILFAVRHDQETERSKQPYFQLSPLCLCLELCYIANAKYWHHYTADVLKGEANGSLNSRSQSGVPCGFNVLKHLRPARKVGPTYGTLTCAAALDPLPLHALPFLPGFLPIFLRLQHLRDSLGRGSRAAFLSPPALLRLPTFLICKKMRFLIE